MSELYIHSCADLVRVEGVGGDVLPYYGYIVCEVKIPLTDASFFSSVIPVLVVPDTRYNGQTPLLIGTNFLSKIPSDQAPSSSLNPHVKSAISILLLRTNYLTKSNGVYSSIRACTNVTVPAFSSAKVSVTASVTIPIRQQIAMIQGITDDIPVVPAVVNASEGDANFTIEILNGKDKPLKLEKGEIFAELHQITLSPPDFDNLCEAEFLNSFDFSHLSEAEAQELKRFLCKNREVFAMKPSEMGSTDVVTHKIELTDPTPFKEKSRPIPPSAYDELRSHLAELKGTNVITESKSPFCSNIVMARKKDGTLRLCIDYRKLNSRTKKDAYNIPRTDSLIDCLQGAKYFATLDLYSGFHQVKLDPDHEERTAFSVGPLGFFQFRKMPFGLCNSPSTFQRLMEQVLDGLTMLTCCVYLDDVIVFAKTKQELYERLSCIFQRLRKANLTLKPKKCAFLKTSVEFLGYIVSKDGVQCSGKHIETVATWPEPTNFSELQTFLGFTGFYRRFVAGYATIAEPLLRLLRGQQHQRLPKKRQNRRSTRTNKPPCDWEWGSDQQTAFDGLKYALTNKPILKHPDYSKPFILHVDASRKGLGAALYQQADTGLHVVAYASRSLNKSEKNYTVHKLEFLALKWSVTVKFQHYLYGNSFKVYTDHNPLAYVTSTAKLDANGHRWLSELTVYDFEIFYKPGKLNLDADGLSRRPHPETEQQQCNRRISKEVLKEICNLIAGDPEFSGVAESLGVPYAAVSNLGTVTSPEALDWTFEQSKDIDVNRVCELVRKKEKLCERMRKAESPGVMKLLSHWDSLHVDKGILYKSSNIRNQVKQRIVIPKHKKQDVLKLIHDDMGHLGRDKTVSLAQERFFWIGLIKDIEHKVKHCYRCLCAKSPNLPQKAPLVSIVTTRPLELVCMDFVSLETSKGGYQHILVVTDHFTKYACAFPTRNQEARTVAKLLFDNFIVHYGIPERLHSDQGANFESKIVKHLCDLLDITKTRTTPYHPQGDGITERFNRTLISMLKTLSPADKLNWKDHVAGLVHAYNCTRHETTGYTPFFLMFGRTPRLPVDIFLGLNHDYPSTVTALKERLDAAYKAATEATNRASQKQAKGYNKTVRGQNIQNGDYVLLKNVGLKGKHKIADKWDEDMFLVVDQPNPDIPVYKIRRGSTTKTIHRNLLLPVPLPIPERCSVSLPKNSCTSRRNRSAPRESCSTSDSDETETLTYNLYSPRRASIEQIADGSLPPTRVSHRESRSYGSPQIRSPSGEAPEVVVDVPQSPAFVNVVPQVPSFASNHADNSVTSEARSPRRSSRIRKPPVRYPDCVVSNNQSVTFQDWRDRVSILLHLMSVFPYQQHQIFNAILTVIMH